MILYDAQGGAQEERRNLDSLDALFVGHSETERAFASYSQ